MSVFTPLEVPTIPDNEELKQPKLTEEQESKRIEVLSHFDKNDYRIPGEEKGELMDEEKMWLSNDCILRYLGASKWVVTTAKQRLEDTLKWRREYGLYNGKLTAEHVEPEAVTGKEVVFGYDTKGRPAFYMIPSRQNTTESPRQLEYVVWMLERCIDLMGPGVESLDLLINFADKAKNPSFSTARQTLHIVQTHYPARLGLALIINVPTLVNAFFKLIMPFVDPLTRNKVKFNPCVFDDGYFTRDQVMKQWWDGEREFEYVHEKYWPVLVEMCEERRKKQFQRWRKLGAKVGISEWDMKTGWSPSSQPEQVPVSEKTVEAPTVDVEPTPAVVQ
ncbi:CRAL/TRIO domain-containing protein [Fomitiporia mediterranea MF3/22]|uniref:CRAL/TRIO domain-containing protein n=1 Tax=Fomitiporia mediterranea (strain MF3/22) TaxID=694068 RepID=UPI000440894E|nr:CRAL/TRIO domain-containing protein [Fomitiporia mediterranea MF3/22]EJD06551.1 CRAL/TRIO domain-containing protein [Fomitiporia mediterranea MF3/22]